MQQHQGFKTLLIIAVIIAGLQLLVMLTRKPVPARHPRNAIVPVKVIPPEGPKKKVAIVLDDWGYNLANVPALEELHAPITVSILPRLPYSAKVAQLSYQAGCEVILHLPCEPLEKRNLEKDTILVSMDEKTILRIVAEDLNSLQYARGISNHMGSRVTENTRVMAIMLKDLRRRGMYFLDSFVTPRIVAPALAREIKVPFAKRDIFLDNSSDPAAIRVQVEKLKKKAARYGFAIGIGHDRRATLQVLKEVVPELRAQGFEIVPVSALTR